MTTLVLSIFSAPEPKAQGELIGWELSGCPSVRLSSLSNINISEISWLIVIKFIRSIIGVGD